MKKIIKEIYPYIIIIIVVLLVKEFIVMPIRVNGSSMEKTLLNKDIMILDRITYRFNNIKRFDIIVIRLDNEYIIKRVIGLPGEKVEYKSNKLYINGKLVKENYKHEKTENFVVEDKLAKDDYFVLGDNRVDSTDSRIIGAISKDRILGHARFTIYPLYRWGSKK